VLVSAFVDVQRTSHGSLHEDLHEWDYE